MPRLGIIGTGLIGASIGLAARSRGWEALGYDRDPAATTGALHADAIDRIAERDEIYATCDLVAIAAATDSWQRAAATLVAAPLATFGVLIERWLFFAEAKHTVMLYYGAGRA